jgi:hypothetical protein
VDVENKFVACKKGRQRKQVPENIRRLVFSLVDQVVDQHLDGKALMDALDEKNLLIDTSTDRFVLKHIPDKYKLSPGLEKMDFSNIHKLIIMYMERHHGKGSAKLFPADFEDFLDKLIAECLKVKLILMHPALMTWLDRIMFRTLSDVCVRMPAMRLQFDKTDPRCLKLLLWKALTWMPYVREVQGKGKTKSKTILQSIAEENKVLKHSNKHREEQKKMLRQLEEGKEQKRSRRGRHPGSQEKQPTAGGGGGHGNNPTAGGGVPGKNSRRGRHPGSQEQQPTAGGGGGHGNNPTAGGGGVPGKNTTAGGGDSVSARQAFASAAARRAHAKQYDEKLVFEACRLMALNRDGFNHLLELQKRLNVEISLKTLAEMLLLEFPLFECSLLDLLEEEGIWEIHQMAEIFKVHPNKLNAIIRMDQIRRRIFDGMENSDDPHEGQ